MVFLSYFVLTSLLLNSNFLSLFLIIFFLSILLSLAAGRRLMQFMFFLLLQVVAGDNLPLCPLICTRPCLYALKFFKKMK